MRLNFAGVPDDDIREGIRRIGRIMGGDTGLLGTLTGSPPPAPGPASSAHAMTEPTPNADELAPMADVVALPRRDRQDSARRRRDR
jgi:2-aminoadipate transaminase